jgi:hypothetical protein
MNAATKNLMIENLSKTIRELVANYSAHRSLANLRRIRAVVAEREELLSR